MTAGKEYNGLEIAIIGMSCRFPQSDSPVQFWNNLVAGKSLLKTFTDEELKNTGVPETVLQDPAYVKTMGVLHDKDCFDRGFFRYGQEEASFMDPQIRIFHELCWKALEDAGYAASIESQKIGLIASASSNETWKAYTYNRMANTQNDPFYLNMLSSPHFISSLIAYKLNLKGPASFVDTACSSSLLAVHNACRTLLTRECDLMLAGGIAIKTQIQKGYYYKEGMVRSNDGQCRAFDAQANGTATGEGGGVVVLKRLKDAIADRDHIYAIIKGTAANNDGNRKVGFTAPSVQGQSECIRKAHKVANVDAATIGYVEAHGTATRLGDPIEIKALNEAFGSAKNDSCAIGSVKTNMGHLDAAAGIAGLIKTALCLKYAQIPPSLNFSTPNPEINFNEGPFYVNTGLRTWQRPLQHNRRAGVSSFGIGGTNVHAILEEAPAPEKEITNTGYQLLCLSARTEHSLEKYIRQLHTFVGNNSAIDMAGMAYTLQAGRKAFPYRKTIVFSQMEELATQLEQPAAFRKTVADNEEGPAIVFMFPGQGSQYVNMAKDLYGHLHFFKRQMDLGFSIIEKFTGASFRDILYPEGEGNSELINDTRYAQPLIFLVEYCLARYMLSLGIRYRHMIGHSIGEYVCACIDGIFGFEDALRLVIKRGELMSSLPGGAMMAVAVSEEEAAGYLTEGISVAAVNGPNQVVLSGSFIDISAQQQNLDKQGVPYAILHTSHAFHSAMMHPILDEFKAELEKTTFNLNAHPAFISNVTGKPVTIEEACSPQYWIHHLKGTVRFHQGIRTLQAMLPKPLFLEVGCGAILINLLKQDPAISKHAVTLNTVRHARERGNDIRFLTASIGKLWEEGVSIDWNQLHQERQPARISLPVYCFEQVRFITEVNLPHQAFTPSALPEETGYTASPAAKIPDTTVERPALSNQYIQPVSETEKKLVALFETFFGIDRIGIGDNFFELGGDSLKAMALLKMIKEQFNLSIMLKDFFNCTDIREIAAIIEERKSLIVQNEKQFTTII